MEPDCGTEQKRLCVDVSIVTGVGGGDLCGGYLEYLDRGRAVISSR